MKSPLSLGNHPVAITTLEEQDTRYFQVDLGSGQSVLITQWHVLGVQILGDDQDFLESKGLCGKWTERDLVARDGTSMSNWQDFATEWQVKDSDGPLFLFERGPQWPAQCTAASLWKSTMIPRAEAESACKTVGPELKLRCVFDSMKTGDRHWPESPFYELSRKGGTVKGG